MSKVKAGRKQGQRGSATEAVAEQLAAAMQMHQQGRIAEAVAIYQSILSRSPEHTDALHFLGVAEYQMGNPERALEHLDRVIAAVPDHPDARNNRGNIFKKLGRLEQAEADYRRALAVRPADSNALNNLGTVLRRRGDLVGAEALFREALALAPDHPGALPNLGSVLKKMDRLEEATDVYRQWLALHPDDPRARHLLASCTGQDVPARAADAYVKAEFDEFADSFDATLARLDYRAPTLVQEEVTRVLGSAERALAVLDAGCGTGLCGPLLRPWAAFLAGVDLSPGMIEQARKRSVYDALRVEELTSYLSRHVQSYDLVVSADTLVYFGELAQVAEAASRSLRPRGTLVFTVERAEAADSPGGYRINPHGRYSHSREYVLSVLAAAELIEVTLREVDLRRQGAEWVPGWLVSSRAPG
jgi:predicted TPR repeat methyltransferase